MEIEGRKLISTELNIAPLIDVVFLLLIFFMLTSTIMEQESIEINLPKSDSAERSVSDLTIISISKDSTIYLNGERVEKAGLKRALESAFAENADKGVVLRSDSDLPVQNLVEMMDLISSAGGANISLATNRKN